MAGTGIEPRSLALLVRCSTTELSRLISTVHLARTTTFLPLTKCSAPKTHTTNTSSPCQDLSNTNAWTGNATAPNVVGIGSMNKYKEIQNENIWLYRESNPGALHHYSNALLLSYRARTTTISMCMGLLKRTNLPHFWQIYKFYHACEYPHGPYSTVFKALVYFF